MTRQPEKRAATRHELRCPVAFFDGEGNLLASARTGNISDAGALVLIGDNDGAILSCEEDLPVQIRIPRRTPNTFMLEEVCARCRVVRIDNLDEDMPPCVAVAFHPQLSLDLDI